MTHALPADFTILALETSCDETAAALVRGGRTILANIVASQLEAHRRYGGIVPEVASRQHILSLAPVVEEALDALPGRWNDVHAVAATYGPGLSGALLTGLNAAKAIAFQRSLPFVGVNHLEAHIYANWLDSADKVTKGQGDKVKPDLTASNTVTWLAPEFPLVALVVSGGHTLLALLRGHGDYELLGQTRDDAVGEAFDKVARILGLDYPGGPAIQQAAVGVKSTGVLPRAWLRGSYDFSFSGLKTAVLHKVQEQQEREARVKPLRDQKPGVRSQEPGARSQEPGARSQEPGVRGQGSGARSQESGVRSPQPSALSPQPSALGLQPSALSPQFVAQMAYAFQESVVDVLVSKTVDAARKFGATAILIAGGVAANTRLRAEMERRAAMPVRYPPIALCTDNAAMVAAAAFYRFDSAVQSGWDLDVAPNLKLA